MEILVQLINEIQRGEKTVEMYFLHHKLIPYRDVNVTRLLSKEHNSRRTPKKSPLKCANNSEVKIETKTIIDNDANGTD
jgi:hypothetical protein